MVDKVFYLLQKEIKLNIRNCNEKNRNKLYDLYNNIVLNKFIHSNKYKNNFLFGNDK